MIYQLSVLFMLTLWNVFLSLWFFMLSQHYWALFCILSAMCEWHFLSKNEKYFVNIIPHWLQVYFLCFTIVVTLLTQCKRCNLWKQWLMWFVCDFLQWYSPTSCGLSNIFQVVIWIMLPFLLRQYGKKDLLRKRLSTGLSIINYYECLTV